MEYSGETQPSPARLADEFYQCLEGMLEATNSRIMVPDVGTEIGRKYGNLYDMTRLPITEISSALHTDDTSGEYTVYTVSDTIPSYLTETNSINHEQQVSYRLIDEYRFIGYAAERRNRFNDTWNVMSPQDMQIQIDRFTPAEQVQDAKSEKNSSFIERAKNVARKAIFWAHREN